MRTHSESTVDGSGVHKLVAVEGPVLSVVKQAVATESCLASVSRRRIARDTGQPVQRSGRNFPESAKLVRHLVLRIVVLDESFAALDPENLHPLQYVLDRADTLLVIAHP